MNLFTSWLKDPKPSQPTPKPQNSNPPAPQPQTQQPRPQQRQDHRPSHGHEQRPQRSHQGPRHQNHGRRPQMPQRHVVEQPITSKPVPSLPQGQLRVLTLGGLEEVGKNSVAFEYGDSAIIIDMGLQFPDENMHGIDYAVTDYGYFKGKEKNIKGVIITHGHLDHIGGIPHVMPRLGLQIPMYCTQLTAALIQKRQEESNQKLNLQVIKPSDTIKIGPFTIDFFRVNHSIPDAVGVVIGTPVGNFVHTGDWKVDLNPINDEIFDFAKLTRIAERGIVAAFCDSTNAYQEGMQMSESGVKDPLESIFFKAKQRVIVGTFASNLSRVQQIIALSEQYGRKVVLLGRTMTNNVLVARNLKYMKVAPHTLITVQEANKLRPDQVTVILTGAQGEKNAALMRAAKGEHKFVQIQRGDTVIFSSSIIPGNEQSVGQLMDLLYRQGAKAINYRMMEVHAGGHAKAEDTKLLLRILKPKYFVPIEGNHYLLCKHAEIAAKIGYNEHSTIIPDNGTVLDFDNQGRVIRHKEKAPHRLIAIDGLGMGDVNESVIAERHEMASDGVFVINMTMSKQRAELIGQPEIITKGFIYVGGADNLSTEAKTIVQDVVAQHGKRLYPNNINELKGMIQSSVGQFLFKKTERQPMILVSILGA